MTTHMGKTRAWIPVVLLVAGRLFGQAPAADRLLLEPGQVIEREISGGQAHSYRVTLAESECAVLIVEQRGIDVSATVYDPADKPIAVFDFEKRKTGEERILVVADTTAE